MSNRKTMTMEAMLCATMAFVLVHVTIVVEFARTPRCHYDCCIRLHDCCILRTSAKHFALVAMALVVTVGRDTNALM